MVSDLISTEEKRHALERVTSSRTFSRSDQLRGLLRYICEAEFEGRAHELNEYVLGVAVLGRPSDYSPAEDSCVRSRAYELRNKLKSYYRLEAPGDPIQIEIRKGAYIPQFQRMEAPAESAPSASPAPVRPTAPPSRTPSLKFIAAVAGLTVLAATLIYISTVRAGNRTPDPQSWTPELAALWKPFISDDTPLIISFEIRLFFYSPSTGLVVRDYRTNQASDLPASQPLAEFRARNGETDLQETSDYADSGAVHAAFLLGRQLGPLHKQIGLKHSSSLGWEDLWNSNVIFVGKPNLNPAVRYSLKSTDFADDELGVIRNLHPLPGEAPAYKSAATHGSGVKYALITLVPGPRSGRHIMILSGAGSELMWALAESVIDPTHVKELVSHLRLPNGELPPAFQAIIEATFESNVPIKVRYITHRATKPS